MHRSRVEGSQACPVLSIVESLEPRHLLAGHLPFGFDRWTQVLEVSLAVQPPKTVARGEEFGYTLIIHNKTDTLQDADLYGQWTLVSEEDGKTYDGDFGVTNHFFDKGEYLSLHVTGPAAFAAPPGQYRLHSQEYVYTTPDTIDKERIGDFFSNIITVTGEPDPPPPPPPPTDPDSEPDSFVTREDVRRTVRGHVLDSRNRPLHGIQVTSDFDEAYTDYKGKALDRTIDGSFSLSKVVIGQNVFTADTHEFIEFEEADSVAVSLQGIELDGRAFSDEALLDLQGLANSLPDGGVSRRQSVETDGVLMLTPEIVDDSGHIHLLGDMKNDHNGHELKRSFSGTRIGESDRYKDEVRAVTRKLASLGFRNDTDGTPLAEVDDLRSSVKEDSRAIQAIRLFQTIRFYGASSKVFNYRDYKRIASGKVDVKMLAELNSISGTLWVMNDASAKAQFANPFTYDATNGNRWMNAAVPSFLKKIGDSGLVSGSQLLISNSSAIGGRFDRSLKYIGISHAAGSEVDMKFLTAGKTPAPVGNFYDPIQKKNRKGELLFDRKGNPVYYKVKLTKGRPSLKALGRTWNYSAVYTSEAQAATRNLIVRLLELGATQVIFDDPAFFSGPLAIPDARFVAVKGHGNHVHFTVPYDAQVLAVNTSGAPTFGDA
jgi:hypothetical protein